MTARLPLDLFLVFHECLAGMPPLGPPILGKPRLYYPALSEEPAKQIFSLIRETRPELLTVPGNHIIPRFRRLAGGGADDLRHIFRVDLAPHHPEDADRDGKTDELLGHDISP